MDYFKKMQEELSGLIAIKSVNGRKTPKNPFGAQTAKALKYYLTAAKKFGFDTINYDNYAGEISVGNGEEFAVLVHLDVVAAGAGWKTEPFKLTVKNNKMYGRGVVDDKGPAVIILYALKSLLDEKFTPKKKIRIFAGLNEESGWGCIEHLKKVTVLPETGFTPDSDFPVIFAEKAILQAVFEFDKPKKLTYIKGGETVNAVADYCKAEYDGKIYEKSGKSAHASTPEKGDNAIEKIVNLLKPKERVFEHIYNLFFADSLGLKKLKDESGFLTMSPDIIRTVKNKIYLTVDFRIPVNIKPDEILARFSDIKIVSKKMQPPLYVDKNSQLVKKLIAAYTSVIGKDAEPVATGGGTYAKALKRGVAFGPQFPGAKSTIHMPDENIKISDFKKLFLIYREALKHLCF